MSWILLWAAACTPPSDPPGTPPDPVPHSTAPTDTADPTDDSAEGTGDTAIVLFDICSELPPAGPFDYVSSPQVQTEEDFDFDGEGFLLTQRNTDLQAVARTGQTHLVASNIGVDAAGIRSLSTGDVMVAQPDTGALRLVNYTTGGSIVVLGGMNFPNGLEATSDGRMFSSEYAPNGRIRLIEPYLEQVSIIGRVDFPNNMALTPDEQVLYVVTTTQYFGGNSRILAFDRDATGNWLPTPRTVHEHPSMLGGITTDSCGNIYAIEFNGGRIFRIRALDDGVDPIAALPPGSYYSSLRFAPGYGDWGRTLLYATNRSQIFQVDVGFEGRHVLAPAE